MMPARDTVEGIPAIEDAIVWTTAFSVGVNAEWRDEKLALKIAKDISTAGVYIAFSAPTCKPKYMFAMQARVPSTVPTATIPSVSLVGRKGSVCCIFRDRRARLYTTWIKGGSGVFRGGI